MNIVRGDIFGGDTIHYDTGTQISSRVDAAVRRAQRAEFFSRTYNAQRSRKVWGHAPT